ncbi:MAG: hypothetical protein EWV67_09735 [Microcystis sp. M_QC_C_20170808_M2Col]|nr:MAG: hypothetical protein EWV67_09735 [Microcystis sp. M_QC_C_20170808_M2Col]TRT64593.1 MAG: hypothetical protein EWV68_19300 [Microcystis sp. M_QC_C_20170808_M9Col]
MAVYILTNKLLYCKHSELLKINYCFYWSAIVVCFFFDFTRQVRKSHKFLNLKGTSIQGYRHLENIGIV